MKLRVIAKSGAKGWRTGRVEGSEVVEGAHGGGLQIGAHAIGADSALRRGIQGRGGGMERGAGFALHRATRHRGIQLGEVPERCGLEGRMMRGARGELSLRLSASPSPQPRCSGGAQRRRGGDTPGGGSTRLRVNAAGRVGCGGGRAHSRAVENRVIRVTEGVRRLRMLCLGLHPGEAAALGAGGRRVDAADGAVLCPPPPHSLENSPSLRGRCHRRGLLLLLL
mmetsp:Transcript_4955/g.9023  ORF Transcript_4955/g.9023 Transcript_4955/m.9023 type:complete len:224 (-) Transcript_4955:1919-2590(-)